MVTGRRGYLAGLALIATGMLAPAIARAEFPDHPIRLVVPYQAGGGVDVIARLVGVQLAKASRQSVVIDNRPGGNGVVGAMAVINAPPDGYTLLLDAPSVAMNIGLMRQPGYDPATDLVPVARVANVPVTITVSPSLPVGSVADLIKLSHSRPQGLNVGFGGAATNLVAELFRMQTGINATFVSYRGSAASATAVMANEAHVLFGDLPSVSGLARSGALRVLAVTTAERTPLMPEAPTARESGAPDYAVEFWDGVFAPRGTPAAVAARLNELLNQVAADPETRERFAQVGATPALPNTAADFSTFFLAEVARWREVVLRGGIERN